MPFSIALNALETAFFMALAAFDTADLILFHAVVTAFLIPFTIFVIVVLMPFQTVVTTDLIAFSTVVIAVLIPFHAVLRKVDIAVTIDTNLFGGNTSLTVAVKEMRPAGLNEEVLARQIDTYEKFKSGIFADFDEIIPTREEVGIVYRNLLSTPASLDRITCTGVSTIGFGKALVSAEALCELKLCSFFDVDGTPVLKVTDKGAKVNLADAPILKSLRGEF